MLRAILLSMLGLSCFLSYAADISSKIVGGTDADQNRWTSLVALVQGTESQTDFYNTQFCAGTLISPQWVLTAAHCVSDDIGVGQYVVATGMYDLQEDTPAEVISISERHIHPSYNADLLNGYDIALLKLSRASNQAIMPIYSGDDLIGAEAIIVGWGSVAQQNFDQTLAPSFVPELQQATTSITSNAVCSSFFGGVADRIFCTETSSEIDTCQGDSGGPLYIYVDGEEVQAGITSGGAGCAFSVPALYTNISTYKDFIEQFTDADFRSGNIGSPMGAISGLWFDRNLDGLGFNFIEAENGLAVYYYGYDASGDPLWLTNNADIGPTAIVKGETYTVDLNQPTDDNGGDFSTAPTTEASGTSQWGELKLTFESCNAATAELIGDDGSVTFNLVRLTNNKGTSCDD